MVAVAVGMVVLLSVAIVLVLSAGFVCRDWDDLDPYWDDDDV